ncbi:MAG: P-loop NTPase [Culicoidibacterales bacterium]
MNYNTNDILAAVLDLQHPTLGISLEQAKSITNISIDEHNKVSLTFDFVKSRQKEFLAFQQTLLKRLKIDLAIEKVSLNFAQEAPLIITPTNPQANSRYIAIISGKGGVGKSTVTVNLARSLHKQGQKVAIIDADIYGASIPQIMQIQKSPPKISGKQVKPFIVGGIEVISSSLLISEHRPVMWKGPMLSKLLRQFFTDVAWSSDIDVFLIDMPPGTGDIMLELKHNVPNCEMIVVTTPQDDAAFVATKAGLAAIELEHEILGIIENMAYVDCGSCSTKNFVFGTGGGAYVAEALGCEILGQIPLTALDTLAHYPPIIAQIEQERTNSNEKKSNIL